MVVIPMMAFIGVRISWDMRERKSDFARLACSATDRASFNASVWAVSFRCISLSSVTSVTSIKITRYTGFPSCQSTQVALTWSHKVCPFRPLTCMVKCSGSPASILAFCPSMISRLFWILFL